MNILVTLLFTTLIVLISVFLLTFRILLVKGGKFPNIHIGGSRAMRDRGVHCATTQDRNAQKKSGFHFAEIIKDIEEK
jgi:hypothetical protein